MMDSSIDTLITLQNELSDSTLNVFDKIECFISSSNSLVYSFWLSVVALLLIYLLKKLYIKELYTGEEILPAIQEFFIDVCMTMIPLIAINCSGTGKVNFGFFLVIIAIILISFCAYLRRKSCDFYQNKRIGLVIACASSSVIICLIFIGAIYYYISESWN